MKRTTKLLSVLLFMGIGLSLSAQWTTIPNTGMEVVYNANVVVKADGKLFACGTNYGMFTSSDEGTSWVSANTGFMYSPSAGRSVNVYDILVDQDTILYAAVTIDSGSVILDRCIYKTSTKNINWKRFKNTTLTPGTPNPIIKMVKLVDTLFICTNQAGNNARYFKLTLLANDSANVVEIPRTTGGSGRMDARNCLAMVVDTLHKPYRLLFGLANNTDFMVYNPVTNTCTKKTGVATNVGTIDLINDTIIVTTNGGTPAVYYALLDSLEKPGFAFYSKYLGAPSGINIKSTIQVGSALIGASSNYGTYVLSFNGTRDTVMFSVYGTAPNVNANSYNGKVFSMDGSGFYLGSSIGVEVSSDFGITYTNKSSGITGFAQPGINKIYEKSGDAGIYAGTTNGVWYSASGNGGDWTLYGTGLKGKSVGSLLFNGADAWCVGSGKLYKLNAGNWDMIYYDGVGIDSAYYAIGGANASIQDVALTPGGNVIVGTWGSKIAGLYRSTDNGVTWNQYNDTVIVPSTAILSNNNGLATSPETTRLITQAFLNFNGSSRIYAIGKQNLQFSDDDGLTWKWTRANNGSIVNGNNTTYRDFFVHNYKGKDFLFMGMERAGGPNIGISRTTISNDSIFFKDGLNNPTGDEVRGFVEFKEDLFFLLAKGSGVYRAYHNGDSIVALNSGLTVLGGHGTKALTKIGKNLYLPKPTGQIFVLDIETPAAFDSSEVINIKADSATVKINMSRNADVYYVVALQTAAAPNDSLIMLGQDGSGNPAVLKGKFAATKGVNTTKLLEPLLPNTSYTCYMMARTEFLINSAVVDKDFTTILVEDKALELNAAVNVFPNPADNAVTVSIVNNYSGPVAVSLKDISGKTVSSVMLVKSGSAIEQSINLQGLNAGTYVVEIICGDEVITQKILKK